MSARKAAFFAFLTACCFFIPAYHLMRWSLFGDRTHRVPIDFESCDGTPVGRRHAWYTPLNGQGDTCCFCDVRRVALAPRVAP